MKILIITPMYEIKDRKNLFHDSSAVHYLLKHWGKECEILVIYTYFNSIKSIGRYVKLEERQWYKKGYEYNVDGINVEMIETQLLINQKRLNYTQVKRLDNKIQEVLKKYDFINPDKLICHLPCYHGNQIVDKINADEKIAILHSSDVKKTKKDKKYILELENNFSRIYTRSKSIYEYFTKFKLKALQKEIICSGIPTDSNNAKRDFSNIQKREKRILFVGKLIKRKNVDLVINALAKISDRIDFKFLIIGKGKERNNIDNLIKKCNLKNKIYIIQEMPRKEVMEQMEKADIFIMPSVNETLGLVYLEAMSKGCLTIATKGEGIDGIILNEKNGMLIEPTEKSIIEIFEKIFNFNEEDFKKYSTNAIKTAYKFEEKKVSKEYYKLIMDREIQKK